MIKNVADIFCCETYALILKDERIRFVGKFAKALTEEIRSRKAAREKAYAKSKEESPPPFEWDADMLSADVHHAFDIISQLRSFSLSPNHVVALSKDNLVYSWGYNDDG